MLYSDFFLSLQFRDFRPLKGQIVHQSFIAEDKTHDRVLDICGVD